MSVIIMIIVMVSVNALSVDTGLDTEIYGNTETAVNTTRVDANTGLQLDIDMNDSMKKNTGLNAKMTIEMNTDNTVTIGDNDSRLVIALADENLQAQVENDELIIIRENGVATTVTVTPQQAIASAEAETGGSCKEECEIEIDEETNVNAEEVVVYEVTVQKQARVLGLWNAEMDIEAKVDVQTGQVINTDRAWWFFLASEAEVNAENS